MYVVRNATETILAEECSVRVISFGMVAIEAREPKLPNKAIDYLVRDSDWQPNGQHHQLILINVT